MKKLRGLFVSLLVTAAILGCFGINAKDVERHITVIMTTYNNNESLAGEPQCVRCLDSILDQCYKNFSVIVVDNGSTDGTTAVMKKRVKTANQEQNVVFVENDMQAGIAACQYKAVYMCKDDDIVMPLHATKMLAHEHVFKHINNAYSDKGTWFTYAHSLQVPSYTVESPEELTRTASNTRSADASVRYPAHTFYAWLYKSINMQDLIYQGSFLEMAHNEPAVLAMVEMAGQHIAYMPEVMTVATDTVSHMVSKSTISSKDMRSYLSSLRSYNSLKIVRNRTKEIEKSQKVDALILVPGNTHQLRDLVQSMTSKVKNIGTIYIIYDRNYSANVLKKVVGKYTRNKLEFVRLYKDAKQNQKELAKVLATAKNDYMLVASTEIDLRRAINIKAALRDLEKTGAHAYYFDRGLDLLDSTEKMRYIRVSNESYAYQYMTEKNTWKANSPIAMAIYRRTEIVDQIKKNKFSKLKDVISTFEKRKIDESQVALISQQTSALLQIKKSKPLTDVEECPCSECRIDKN